MMRPDLRPRVIWAQLRRFLHWARSYVKPRERRPRCCDWDYTMCAPQYDYKPRKMIVACYCGKEFYRDPEFTLEREEEMRRIFNQ